MSEIKNIGEGGTPMPFTAIAPVNGYVVKGSGTGGQMALIVAKGDAALAVVAKSSLDPQDGTAEALTAGDEWPVFPLGCGKIVEVASITSSTYTSFASVYLDDSVDGQVTASASTSTPIGLYYGAGVTTSAAGEIIPVWLCIEPDATPE